MNRGLGELYQYGSTLNIDETKEVAYTERKVFGNAIISLDEINSKRFHPSPFLHSLGCVLVENTSPPRLHVYHGHS